MRTAIYVRVSTEEQVREGYSISAQTQKLKAFCISQDWDVADFYIDEGISAKDMERADLKRMMKDIENGKIDCVLVYRLDRLTRSVFDLYKMLETFDKYDCKFKSATEVYDTTTAMGRMFITIVAALAQWERENMGERFAMAYQEKARQGKYPHTFGPFGYDLNKESFILEINEDEAVTVRDIHKMYEHVGMNGVAKSLNDDKITTRDGNQWTDNTISKILKNPVYTGKILWNKVLYDGLHEPIIDSDTWNRTQETIKERTERPPRTISSNFIFSGKLKCPSCGRPMSGYYTNGNYKSRVTGIVNRTKYFQYRCRQNTMGRCSGSRNVSETQLEKSFVDFLDSIDFTSHFDKAAEEGEKELNKHDKLNVKRIKADLKRLESRKKKWQYAWMEEMINDKDFKSRMKETNEKEQQLLTLLEEASFEEELFFDKTEIIKVVKDIKKNWNELERLEKKSIVNTIVEQIHCRHTTPNRSYITIDDISFKTS